MKDKKIKRQKQKQKQTNKNKTKQNKTKTKTKNITAVQHVVPCKQSKKIARSY